MNPTVATVCVIFIALALGAALYALYRAYLRAEARLHHVISTRLAAADDHRNASQAWSRAFDDEYEQLVLKEHNKGTA